MAETPEYTKRAIKNYNNKFDRVAVNLPKGSKEKIKQLTGGQSCNAFINVLVREKLEDLEAANEQQQKDADQGNDLPEFMRD